MSKMKLRQQVFELRKKGMSYSQIKNEVQISKSTLSNWLKNLPLSKVRIRELRGRNEKRIERFRQTMLRKKNERLNILYKEEKGKLLPLSKRELFLSGLFLYWGEGNKSSPHTMSINNSDPAVVQFSLLWVTECLGIDKEKIKAFLHLYKDMDIQVELKFWSNILDIPVASFNKPYIKDTNRKGINHKGFGHGTCGIMVNNTHLKERIMMGLKAVKDSYSRKNLIY
jgi:hypothetical protein